MAVKRSSFLVKIWQRHEASLNNRRGGEKKKHKTPKKNRNKESHCGVLCCGSATWTRACRGGVSAVPVCTRSLVASVLLVRVG